MSRASGAAGAACVWRNVTSALSVGPDDDVVEGRGDMCERAVRRTKLAAGWSCRGRPHALVYEDYMENEGQGALYATTL